MKKQSVRKTLFFSYFIPILITIVFLSILFFLYNSKILRDNEESNLTDITDKMVSIIDSEISKMNALSLNITNSNLLKEKIREFRELKTGNLPIDGKEYYLISRDISNILAMTAGPVKSVPQVNFIDPGFALIGSGTYNLLYTLPEVTTDAVEEIDSNFGKRHFSGPVRDILAEEAFPIYKNQKYISLFRTIFDKYMSDAIGIIEVKQFAETIFYGFSKTPNKFLIFDSELNQLYPYTINENSVYSTILAENSGESITNFRNPDTGKKEIISIGSCREINWKIINVVEEREFLDPVYNFLLIIFIGGIAVFSFGTLVAHRLSRLITDSLSELNGWISNLHWDLIAEENNSENRLLSPLGEFEEIHQAFLDMNKKLAASMRMVVEERALQENARMLALQSQMDPHFMYNMLTTISIMAEEGENNSIVDTISHLTSILRYSASRSKLYVTLSEEAMISIKYLECMKIRYGENLNFAVDIDKAIENFIVPKLILLPLVENSIKYATNTEPPWEIRIIGTVSENNWIIRVEDSGTGFSPEAIRIIQDTIKQCDIDTKKQLQLHIEGLGIINIYSRLRIYFKDKFHFRIDVSEKGGACIEFGGSLEQD